MTFSHGLVVNTHNSQSLVMFAYHSTSREGWDLRVLVLVHVGVLRAVRSSRSLLRKLSLTFSAEAYGTATARKR